MPEIEEALGKEFIDQLFNILEAFRKQFFPSDKEKRTVLLKELEKISEKIPQSFKAAAENTIKAGVFTNPLDALRIKLANAEAEGANFVVYKKIGKDFTIDDIVFFTTEKAANDFINELAKKLPRESQLPVAEPIEEFTKKYGERGAQEATIANALKDQPNIPIFLTDKALKKAGKAVPSGYMEEQHQNIAKARLWQIKLDCQHLIKAAGGMNLAELSEATSMVQEKVAIAYNIDTNGLAAKSRETFSLSYLNDTSIKASSTLGNQKQTEHHKRFSSMLDTISSQHAAKYGEENSKQQQQGKT